jgi:hypothetical protein
MGWLVDLIRGLRLSLGGGRSGVVVAWWVQYFLFVGRHIGVLGNADTIFRYDEMSSKEVWNGESRDTRLVIGEKPIPKNRAGLHMLVGCVHALV